ncbi:hypothetical protein GCM10007874_39930 [Labrys miyagiensis]|uniref:Stress-induced protein n=1 Tax=Labrys miyagiensis TaxID=346912 RepID=A0ABQ6CS08_9HYPH|nr:KGG domain-containing protein [Labrys miyagiensis]GLS20976.1 hypothetical protein GCM10007874_39930 [Labrys miyagiensis]
MTQDKPGGKGNFADDPKRAAEAGKKGGEKSHGGQHQQSSDKGGAQQGSGNFADDPERAPEAGKKGGQR